MINPETNRPNPVITVHFRPSKWRIFVVLLWAEFTPRLRGLALSMILLGLCGFGWEMYEPYRAIEGPATVLRSSMDFLAGIIAVTAVIQGTVVNGFRRNSKRPLWTTLALPVKTFHLVVPAILFHWTVALFLAGGWAALRYHAEIDRPAQLPVMLLLPLAAQGQAAMYWITAAGTLRGTLWSSLGLGGATFAAYLVGEWGVVNAIHPYTLFLVLGGMVSTMKAAYILRGDTGQATSKPMPSRRTGTTHLWVAPWSRLSARCLPTFHTPFWAQVWFEWRHTAMWLPIIVGSGLLLGRALDRYDSDPFGFAFGVVLFGAPVVIAYAHNRVSPQYRSFVLIRPLSSQRAGRAKTTAMALALLLVTCVSVVPRLISGALHGHLPSIVIVAENSVPITTSLFFAVYGLLGIAAALLRGFVEIPLLMLRYALMGLFDPYTTLAGDKLSPLSNPILGAGALTSIVTTWLLLSGLSRRLGADLPWPRELWAPIAALLVPIAIGLGQFNDPMQIYATAYYAWATPFITLGALFAYAFRMRLISWQDGAAGLAFFLFLYAIGGYTYASPSETSGYFINMHFGHWCVVLVSPILWYPFIISMQRYGKSE